MYEMVVAAFSVTDKANWIRFFEEIFLVANISLEIVFEMLFLTLNGADIDFSGRGLWWKTYTIEKAFPTIRHVQLVDKKKFAAVVLDSESETFLVHIASLSSVILPSVFLLELDVHPSRRPQISGLIAKKALTKVSVKYLNFTDIFSLDLTFKLPKQTRINNHTIELLNSQQPSYRPIYSLGLVELEILKAYIKTNLANKFIKPFKSPANTPILFNQKLDSSL